MSGPVDKTTLTTLAEVRLEEAKCLLQHGFWSGAYYLAGYAVELALKATIAKQFGAEQIPDPKLAHSIFTHNLEELLSLAGLRELQKNTAEADPEFEKNWGLVRNWKEDSRYKIEFEDRAIALVGAVSESKSGVLQWIQMHW